MKIGAAEVLRVYARPDETRIGLLIHGADPMRVALMRQDVIAALVGPEAEAEMRLARMSGGDLRRDPAALLDAVKAQGFFPGPRAVLVDDATDGLAPLIQGAMADWRPGDATLVATAALLPARSALRKLFEGNPRAHLLGLYDDPPSRAEVEAVLARAGVALPPREAMNDLMALAGTLDPGDFRQTVEKIALYKLGDAAPLSGDEIALLAPATVEAEVDEVVHAAADGRHDRIGPLMRRLDGQGQNAVGVCLAATRHFRALHGAVADPGGAAAGLARARPPVYGPRRDRMLRQAQTLGLHRIEEAMASLIETDLVLRSASRAPAMALVERALIRIARLPRR